MERKKIILLVAFCIISCCSFASKYKVLFINSSGIKVGTKTAIVGQVFSDKDRITWTNDQQAMKVINLDTKRIMVIAAKALKKKKASSLYDYLTTTRHLSTRSIKKHEVAEEWQLDSTLYLLDTLYVKRPSHPELAEARIVDVKGTKRKLPTTKDGSYYIITREIYNHQPPYPIKVSIMEFDKMWNWEYVVYRNLIIEPLTIKIH